MTIKLGLYLTGDSPEFEKQAVEWVDESHAACFPVRSVDDMLDKANPIPNDHISHLAIFSHGTTKALGKPGRFGIDIRPKRWAIPERYISPAAFAEAWAPVMQDDALISLCACLCGRSQHWYLIKLYGKVVSPWGAESYENGGATSLAMRLVKAFEEEGRPVRVRAHCAAGHCTYQALLREFTPGRAKGWSLFRMVIGEDISGVSRNTLRARRRWQAVVKGGFAEQWLLGNDGVVDDIKAAMGV